MKFGRKWLAATLAALLILSGCGANTKDPAAQDPTGTTKPAGTTGNLVCVEISRFSGGFVEDGSHAQVQDVAAILIANNTGKFLEMATVTYQVGERTATFMVTGLPHGKQAWVLEANRLTLSEGDELELKDCQEVYNPNAITATNDVAVQRRGNSLTLTNTSGKKLTNVVVYYKDTLEGGAYMGGITYFISFGDLEPGATVTQTKDHFDDTSEIVRFSYQ